MFLETKFIFKITIKSVFGKNELHLKFVYKSQENHNQISCVYFTRNQCKKHEILLKTYNFYERVFSFLRNKN